MRNSFGRCLSRIHFLSNYGSVGDLISGRGVLICLIALLFLTNTLVFMYPEFAVTYMVYAILVEENVIYDLLINLKLFYYIYIISKYYL